jgi:CspA family cold shock protein
MTNNGAIVGCLCAFTTTRLRACGLKSNLSRRAASSPVQVSGSVGRAMANSIVSAELSSPSAKQLHRYARCHTPPDDAEMASFQVRFHCISRQPQVMEATQLWRPSMARGTVKWFNSQKGYGFIQPQAGGKDVFVHISAVEKAGLTGLNEGQTIEYEEVSNRGKTSAENLKVQR